MAYRKNETAIGIYATADGGFAAYDREGVCWFISDTAADDIAARVADTAERKRDKEMAR
jgi:hypothetical protein